MSATGDQIWLCCKCESTRQWGDGYPEEIVNRQLFCSYCEKVTAHRFSHVDFDPFTKRKPQSLKEIAQ